MNEIKYKIFKNGIFGVRISDITQSDFEALKLDQTYEIFNQQQRDEHMQTFKYKSFLSIQEFLYEKYKKNEKDNAYANCNFYKQEISYEYDDIKDNFIRINLIAWKQMATANMYNFRADDFYLVFNEFVTCDDFINVKDLKKKYNDNTKKGITKLVEKMTEYKLFEHKKDDQSNYYRIIKKDDKLITSCFEKDKLEIDLINRIEHDEAAICRKIKKFLIASQGGTLCTEICKMFELGPKPALRLLKKIISEDKDFVYITESVGKVFRYRFLHVDNVETYKTNLRESEFTKKPILHEDKIIAMKALLSEYRAFCLSKEMAAIFAKIIGSTYIPDNKNFRHIAKKAGAKLIYLEADMPIYRYIVCIDDVKEEEIEREKRKAYAKKIKLNKTNDTKIIEHFINYDEFIKQDNGYKNDKNERIYNFICFLIEESKEKGVFNFDLDFIEKIKLNIITKFISFIYFLEEHTIKEKTNLRFVKIPKNKLESDILHEKNLKELKQKGYENFDVLQFEKIFAIEKFDKYFDYVIKHKIFEIEKIPEGYKILNQELSNYKNKINFVSEPFISFNSRIKFMQQIANFSTDICILDIYNILEKNFEGEEYEALYLRLVDYKKKIKSNKSLPDREYEIPKRLYELYKNIKNLFIDKIELSLTDISFGNEYDRQKIIQYLIKEKIIKKFNDHDYKLTNNFNRLSNKDKIKTIFPLKYFNLHKKDIVKDKYFEKFYDLVFFIIAQCGSIEINNLKKKIVFLHIFELEEFFKLYYLTFNLEIIDCKTIINLK